MPSTFSRTTRSLTNDSAIYALISWVVGGIFLSGWLLWFFYATVIVYELSPKARLEVNRSSHPIVSLVADKIIASRLVLGQEVKEGEILAALDASSDQLRLQEEESRLKAIPPQLIQLEKQITSLEQAKVEDHQAMLAAIQSARSRQSEASSAVAFAKDNEQRLSQLSNLGQIPLIETLRARAEVQKLSFSREALSNNISHLDKEALTRAYQEQAEIERLKREMAKLKGDMITTNMTIVRLKQTIDKHQIRAPANGQIGDLVPLQVGTYVAVGEKLGTVVPHSELRIVADFPPASVIGRIHPGQVAQMRLDGFPWAQFGTLPAKVSRVGAEIRDNQVRVEFTPEIAANSTIVLQHGLPGTIEVTIEQLSPAILALRAAGQLMAVSKSPNSPPTLDKP